MKILVKILNKIINKIMNIYAITLLEEIKNGCSFYTLLVVANAEQEGAGLVCKCPTEKEHIFIQYIEKYRGKKKKAFIISNH